MAPLRPPPPRTIPAPLRVESNERSSRGLSTVGTAFDCLFRFELNRKAPHALTRRWVAERAADMINGGTGSGLLARTIVADARTAVASYVKTADPDRAELSGVAAHAIRLATLDPVYRTGDVGAGPDFDADVSAADVEDLLAMLDVVPTPLWKSLCERDVLLL